MTLNHKVEVYVPINDREQEMVMEETLRKFTIEFGGATMNPVLGSWFSDTGTLVMDKIGIVYSYVSELTPAVKKFVKDEAVRVRKRLNEDAVTAVIDDKADFY